MDEREARGADRSRTDLRAKSKRALWRTEKCISEDGCDRPPIARNLCSKHYQRAAATGILPPKVRTAGKRLNLPEHQCSVPGCVVRAKAHGLCPAHYGRSRRYGLGNDELAALDAGKCETCGSTERLHVDHDHETGAVRGLLCQGCNNALGGVKDSPETLVKLAVYLIRSKEAQAA